MVLQQNYRHLVICETPWENQGKKLEQKKSCQAGCGRLLSYCQEEDWEGFYKYQTVLKFIAEYINVSPSGPGRILNTGSGAFGSSVLRCQIWIQEFPLLLLPHQLTRTLKQ